MLASASLPYSPLLDNFFFRLEQKIAASQGRGEQPSPCPLPGGEGEELLLLRGRDEDAQPGHPGGGQEAHGDALVEGGGGVLRQVGDKADLPCKMM